MRYVNVKIQFYSYNSVFRSSETKFALWDAKRAIRLLFDKCNFICKRIDPVNEIRKQFHRKNIISYIRKRTDILGQGISESVATATTTKLTLLVPRFFLLVACNESSRSGYKSIGFNRGNRSRVPFARAMIFLPAPRLITPLPSPSTIINDRSRIRSKNEGSRERQRGCGCGYTVDRPRSIVPSRHDRYRSKFRFLTERFAADRSSETQPVPRLKRRRRRRRRNRRLSDPRRRFRVVKES